MYHFCSPDIDVWKSIADLCNVLKEVDISYVKLYPQKKEGNTIFTIYGSLLSLSLKCCHLVVK